MEKKSIGLFMLKAFLTWLIPMSLLIGVYVVFDPMLTLRWHEDMIPGGFLPNKGNVTVKQFDHYYPEKHYDSFIVGSSITINHWIEDWLEYIPEDSSPFHFDGSTLTIKKTAEFVDYIVENSDVKRILIILPPSVLHWEESDYLPFMIPSELKTTLSEKLNFQWEFFKSFYTWNYLQGYLIHNLFGAKATANSVFKISDDIVWYDPIINEERALIKDAKLEKEREQFIKDNPEWESLADNKEIKIFKPLMNEDLRDDFIKMRDKMDGKGVDYLIVVTPRSNREILGPSDDAELYEIYGKRYINLDYEQIKHSIIPYNWYDATHYRHNVGSELMKRIYETRDNHSNSGL